MTPGERIARAVFDLIRAQTGPPVFGGGFTFREALARELDAALPSAESPTPASSVEAVKGAELAPCPFCGGSPNALEETEGGRRWWCQCGECGATSRAFGSRAEAVTAWNRRPAPAPPAPRKEGEGEPVAWRWRFTATEDSNGKPLPPSPWEFAQTKEVACPPTDAGSPYERKPLYDHPPRPLDDALVAAARSAVQEAANLNDWLADYWATPGIRAAEQRAAQLALDAALQSLQAALRAREAKP